MIITSIMVIVISMAHEAMRIMMTALQHLSSLIRPKRAWTCLKWSWFLFRLWRRQNYDADCEGSHIHDVDDVTDLEKWVSNYRYPDYEEDDDDFLMLIWMLNFDNDCWFWWQSQSECWWCWLWYPVGKVSVQLLLHHSQFLQLTSRMMIWHLFSWDDDGGEDLQMNRYLTKLFPNHG